MSKAKQGTPSSNNRGEQEEDKNQRNEKNNTDFYDKVSALARQQNHSLRMSKQSSDQNV